LTASQFGDSAILIYQASTKFSDDGTMVDGNVRGTNVYLRRQGLWQLYVSQQTSIA